MALSNKSTQSKIFTFRNFVFGMILGGGVYLILIILSNWEQLLEYLGRIPVEIIIIAMGLSFLNYLCRFAKWLLFTKSLKLEIPFLFNFKVFMAGLALAITPAKAGEAIRAFLLKKGTNVDLSKGLASTFSERLIDLLAVTILSIMGIIIVGFTSDYLIILLVILSLVLFGVIVILSDILYNFFSRIVFIGPFKRFRNNIDKFRDDIIVTFHWPVLLGALLLGILGWACECFAFMLIAQSLDIPMSFQMATFIYATSSIIGAISFLPGGLGLMEGGLGFLVIDILNVSFTVSVALTLVIRFTTLWFGVGLGLVFLLILTRDLSLDSLDNNTNSSQMELDRSE
ncbi:MAG: flippase-like domain-containing protein [Candidatus Heimdallarchaeota archaeon]|nr:flippase-like domain-containing protein [Candidatus Heimdallarchaeota archaeon]